MLTRSVRKKWVAAKAVVERNEGLFNRVDRLGCSYERIFQRIIILIILVKEVQKIKRISGVKGTVFKRQKPVQIALLVIPDKIIGCTVHILDQLSRFF